MGMEPVKVPGSAAATPERKKQQQPGAEIIANNRKKTPSSPHSVFTNSFAAARSPAPSHAVMNAFSAAPSPAPSHAIVNSFSVAASPAPSYAVMNSSFSAAPSPGPSPAPSPAPVIIRNPSPSGGRRRSTRRATFKKSASFKARKEADDGAAAGGKVKDDKSHPNNKKSSSSDEEDEGRLKQGPWFLKLAKTCHAQGDNPLKAFQFASRAIQCFEKSAAGKSSLDLVVSLHILAALQCRLGHFEEAVTLLERALSIPDPDAGIEHTLATFAGHMQLGDTLALQGKHQLALFSYQAGLQVQKHALGDLDIRVAETCRYVAEAHLQAMQFDEAGELCELALRIHQEKSAPGSLEEAADRRLMALVCSGKGDHESALEHLVLSSTVMLANGLENDVAAVDSSIGDALLALGRDTEAALSYQKALTAFRATKGEGHASVASVFVRLAELYLKTRKPREAKTYCESALRIFGTQGAGHALEDIVYGLTDIAGIYEVMTEREQAISLLSRAVDIQGSAPGQTFTCAGVEAQLGILYFMTGKFPHAFSALSNSVAKLKSASDGKKPVFLGMLLNQLGLTAVELCEIEEASSILEESKSVMEEAAGPLHPDTLSVCSNLAGTYDALGRTNDAIALLETVVDVKEDKYGSVHPEVADERRRLAQLLHEVGRTRTRKLNTLEELLSMAKLETHRH